MLKLQLLALWLGAGWTVYMSACLGLGKKSQIIHTLTFFSCLVSHLSPSCFAFCAWPGLQPGRPWLLGACGGVALLSTWAWAYRTVFNPEGAAARSQLPGFRGV